ncbi:MAG: DNA polymerase III subunit alpha, partial [Acidocella sp. 20-61-6]
MPFENFVHLRVHSAYSLSEGAIKVDQIPALARAGNMPAVAITDTSNMFGALEFSQYCVGKGVQPIIGCQLGLARKGSALLAPDYVVLLAQTPTGFANLQKLSSLSFLGDEASAKAQISFLGDEASAKAQISMDMLASHAEGLFLLTGGAHGPIGRLLAEGQVAEAETLLGALQALFPDRIGMELQRHGETLEAAVEPGLITLADKFAIPLVATNECYFATPGMYEAHDALLCIAEGRVLAEPERRRVTPEHWFKPAADMRQL